MRGEMALAGLVAVSAQLTAACGPALNQTSVTCSPGRTLLDGVCVNEGVADYVACVRAQGAQLGGSRSQQISADAGFAGIRAGGAVEVSETLEKKYSVSADATLEIIRECRGAARLSASSPKSRATDHRLRVRTFIDGRSRLVVKSSTAFWRHLDWAAPGRLEKHDEPTTINGVAWRPRWPDATGPENRDCQCDSTAYDGVPRLEPVDQDATLEIVQGRDKVHIVKQPREDNGYTLEVELSDSQISADWYEFVVTYRAAP